MSRRCNLQFRTLKRANNAQCMTILFSDLFQRCAAVWCTAAMGHPGAPGGPVTWACCCRIPYYRLPESRPNKRHRSRIARPFIRSPSARRVPDHRVDARRRKPNSVRFRPNSPVCVANVRISRSENRNSEQKGRYLLLRKGLKRYTICVWMYLILCFFKKYIHYFERLPWRIIYANAPFYNVDLFLL